jgi:hypothetical protein
MDGNGQSGFAHTTTKSRLGRLPLVLPMEQTD